MIQPSALHLLRPQSTALHAERRLPPCPVAILGVRSARLTLPVRAHTPHSPLTRSTPPSLPPAALPSQAPSLVLHSP